MNRDHFQFMHFHLHPSIPIPAAPAPSKRKRSHHAETEPTSELRAGSGHTEHLMLHSRISEAYHEKMPRDKDGMELERAYWGQYGKEKDDH